MDNIIFALDIGTRSIVGVVCEIIDGCLKVVAIKSVFHNQRSMIDGQIEDIAEVSRIIGIVKEDLESSLNIKLDKVCIAAAGRSLKTERIMLEKESDIRVPITEDFKNAMELEALQLAQKVFSKDSLNEDLFYCVGYSVLNYILDDKTISNIVGHRGKKVSIEIIAAFLPHTVIEGLYSCMDNNDLEVVNLTLEPIAAMDLIIPKELRLLNLALIDIGAGTSDIAISKVGTVVGYDMATLAGDEITECIMKNYIVDFNNAESIKASLIENIEEYTITNILGIPQKVSKDQIFETIRPSILDLCSDIASKILKLNNEPPAAVFLAGGGSKIPFLREVLSELLDVPLTRIAIAEKNSIKDIDLSLINEFGPELITPIGIAYSVILNKNYDFFSVIVNNKKVRLYSIRQMKVMDALLMSGFDTKQLIGISGKSLRFYVNGKEHFYAGEYSTPAQIYVNSLPANIETTINPGDLIKVVPATDGASPKIKISDIDKCEKNGQVYFNGIKTEIGTKYYVNNVLVNSDYIIGNSDLIEISKISSLKDLINLFNIYDETNNTYFVNGKLIEMDFELYDGCIIDISSSSEKNMNNTEYENNNKSNELEEKSEINSIEVTINNENVKLPVREDNTPYIFADMLNYTDIDPANPKGNIILLHNGKEASYLNLISNKDVIIIKWDTE
ncbi:cell division protein FtsA [Sedimentibacter sp. MB31-C6]|uniref:cell division protein FtsA n=1 Tax=Sedimentibacter sp. MB31-C6 TaxID=3109366 RepID=UPI002DDDAB13|nr:cell division FtsA domain-containing protein [Sedimentibacter sp. MB36-C1]WSI04958.1 cell division FtsA domain-containing protein [Sedimentibacter sp. MB36-C1]